MIQSSLAGAIGSSSAFERLSTASLRICTLPPLLCIRQTPRPVFSRASSSWKPNDVGKTKRISSTCAPSRRRPILLQLPALFSTSTTHRLQREDGKTSATKITKRPSASTATAKLATTLKSTLKLDKTKHENIYNIPNFLTLTRLVATPVIGYLIVHNYHLYAFSLFTYAAFSDLLDGWIARKWKLQTVVGSVVDPMADKLLMTTLVTCLAVNGSLSMPLFVLILGRDASLSISAFYYRYASLPAPKTMARYWDFSLPSAEPHRLPPGGVLLSIPELLGGEQGVKNLITGLSTVVASTTVYSGLEYTWSKKAVVILGGDEALKRKQGLRGRMIMASGFGSFIALAVYLWYKGQAENAPEKTIEEE
ncbi:similar to phosphatidyl synthase [Plenodomus lingam JN3]|uniref:Similar to phosphatidyl synthase n=1 Tax=Leptosphaeria maculans (strain JN3 / isolate v23.1.3 / race Av1-4-5-6-7-8) TaxID=985895 RepID=E5ABW7_LEPMJ|nr:similar to phosphatidyl synthase [Plenodomus lingam JN3]CBY01158.1 similar to phosphatidyl synthase [Plenodomus lingam JN3]